MSNYSCNEHGKNYVDGCLACDFPREFEELERENEDLRRKVAAMTIMREKAEGECEYHRKSAWNFEQLTIDLRHQLNEALRHLGNVVSVREMVFHPTAEWYAAEEYYSKQENSDE